MNLPFTHDQFLALFAEYNQGLWPFAILLWLLAAVAAIILYRGRGSGSTMMAATLALLWGWGGLEYHLALFSRINPAANIFAILFFLQGGLLVWRGVIRNDLTFEPSRSLSGGVGLFLIIYSLLYPLLGLLFGLRYPFLPTFGVPCPTAIFTTGALLLVSRRQAWLVAIIPLLWSAVGGSAAFVLGIHADLALVAGGVALLIHLILPNRQPLAIARQTIAR